jgi:hypothetical protein
MMQIILIGLGAGAAAALMFASVASGAMLSIVLFYLAPLPIMVAALGWSHWAGLLAVLCAAAMLGLGFGTNFFAAFLAGIGLPAWWLSYLALLARPATNGTGSPHSPGSPVSPGSHMEWYPLGRLVLWAAFLGAAVVAAALMSLGSEEDTIRAGLKSAIERILGSASSGEEAVAVADDAGRVIDLFVIAMPPVAAVIAALTQACNLWLAARIAMLSGRLKRPWADLSGMSFPPAAAAALALTIALSFLPGLAGLMASLFAATLTLAFAILGFAVMHVATRGMNARAVILAGAYGVVAAMGWPVLIMTLVGIAETIFGLRARRGLGSPPAAPAG